MLINPKNTSLPPLPLFSLNPNLNGQVEALQADNEIVCVWTVLCPLRKSLYPGVAMGGKKERERERERKCAIIQGLFEMRANWVCSQTIM